MLHAQVEDQRAASKRFARRRRGSNPIRPAAATISATRTQAQASCALRSSSLIHKSDVARIRSCCQPLGQPDSQGVEPWHESNVRDRRQASQEGPGKAKGLLQRATQVYRTAKQAVIKPVNTRSATGGQEARFPRLVDYTHQRSGPHSRLSYSRLTRAPPGGHRDSSEAPGWTWRSTMPTLSG